MSDDNSSSNEGGHDHNEHDGHNHGDFAQTQPATTAPATQAQGDAVGDHKLYAILGYILPFLFFLPLVQDSSKNNAFARFHANQQLILLILWVAVQFVLSNVLYMVMSMGAYTIMPLLNLVILVLAILGIVHAAQGEMKELPVVGKFKLIDSLFKQ